VLQLYPLYLDSSRQHDEEMERKAKEEAERKRKEAEERRKRIERGLETESEQGDVEGEWHLRRLMALLMPPPFEEWWRGIKGYPGPCVRACVHPCVRLSVIKIWCPLKNF